MYNQHPAAPFAEARTLQISPSQFLQGLRSQPKIDSEREWAKWSRGKGRSRRNRAGKNREKLEKFNRLWPGVVAISLAGYAVIVFRGCWPGKMSWPLGVGR
jgi:hypothetical protein